jgi:hypothetical protein
MRIIRFLFVLCLGYLLFGSSLIAFGQITASQDAYTNSSSPTTNYGKATTLGLANTATSIQTSYMLFDLSSIPAGYTGANVAKATLKLYVNTVPTTGSFNLDYITSNWTETGITYNDSPTLGSTVVSGVSLAGSNAKGYLLIDVTAAMQAWLNGAQANDGLALVANSALNATFDSNETTTQSHPPELDVVFGGNGTITGVKTAAGSGLTGGGNTGTLNLSLLKTCAANQGLRWNGSSWACSSTGSGTITGVTAGTDLTGGGISGSVTLNLDTTKVPLLGAANTFTNNNTISVNNSTPGLQVSNSTGDGAKFSGGYDAAEFTGGIGGGIYADTHADADFTAAIYGNEWGTTTQTYGVWGYSASFNGNGVLGRVGAGSSLMEGGTGVWGDSSYSFGVAGTSSAQFFAGVSGYGTNGSYGVDGESDSAIGVYGATQGEANAIAGGNNPSGSPSDLNATMTLQNGSSVPEFVLYAEKYDGSTYVRTDNNGNLAATGTIYGASKQFKIDHPLDPADKYLVHTDVESSEMMNIYTGNAVTDAQGDVQVELPDWFEALNNDFRYQLTVIGQFAQAIVSNKISNHRFSIKTDKPNVEVSWQVTGIRHDAWANAHRIPVEIEKSASERGRYLHPEVFGFGPERSVSYNGSRYPRKLRDAGGNGRRQIHRTGSPAKGQER